MSNPDLKKFKETFVPTLENVRTDEDVGGPDFNQFENQFQINTQSIDIEVHILGDVRSPGLYKMPVSNRLSNAVKLARPNRAALRIVEIRHPGEKTKIYDLYQYYYLGKLDQNPYLKHNDVLFIPKHKGVVRVEGPVARPGLYELHHEKTIEDVTQLAGATTTSSSQIKPIKVIRFSEGGEKFVLDVDNTKKERETFKVVMGDIIVIPNIITDPKDFDYKVETIPGENQFYPTATPNVFVVGNVSQSGAYPYKSHLQVKDYVAYASPAIDANLKTVTLIRDGKRTRLKFNEALNAGDIITVKGRPSYGKAIGTLAGAMGFVLTTLLLRQTIQDL